jgi:hypothetical protein
VFVLSQFTPHFLGQDKPITNHESQVKKLQDSMPEPHEVLGDDDLPVPD